MKKLTQALFLTLLLAGGWATALSQPTRPNLVLLISDDQSAASLGCYGDRNARTPNLDRLAGQGVTTVFRTIKRL